MKKQGGFTLIELVVVIVILGILAVTAAPRFLNLQNDARKASLQGLKGAIDGAAGIVYGKAAVQGVDTSDSEVTVDAGNTTVVTIFGYPTASSAGIGAAVKGLNSDDWGSNDSAAAGTAQYSFKGTTKWGIDDSTGCNVTYTQATSIAEATTAVYSGGC